MIRDFGEVKKQLQDLAKLINAFQSEAVQLRLLEILLSDGGQSEEEEGSKPKRKAARKRAKLRPKAKVSDQGKNRKGKAPKKGRVGGYAMMSVLVNDGFFKKKRTANDIIIHCKKNKAIHYKAGDFTGKLGSLTRDEVLKRDKNSNKQYEYWQE